MNFIALFLYHVKHQIRTYISNNWLRRIIITLVLLLLIGGIVLGLAIGLNPPPRWSGNFQSKEFIENFSGLLFMITVFIIALPTYVIIKGALFLIETPETEELKALSPIANYKKFSLALGPIVFLSSIPYLIVVMPFIIMFILLDPIVSIFTFSYFLILSSWSIVLSMASLIIIIDLFGKETGLKIAYLIPFILFLLPVGLFYFVADMRVYASSIGYWQLVFFGISFFILPYFLIQVSKSFFNILIGEGIPQQEWAVPKFGNYNPWVTVDRSAITWGMIPLAIFIGLLIFDIFHIELIHESVIVLLLLSLITAPLNILFSQEKKNPMRWLLAPYSKTHKKIILLKVGLPLIIFASIIIIYVGLPNNLLWTLLTFLIFILAIIVTTMHSLYKYPVIEKIVSLLLLIACFATQYLFVNI